MATDIHGWVEMRIPFYNKEWWRVIDIEGILGRHYNMFALLFGQRNAANWQPVAEGRGLPTDVSQEVKKDYGRFGAEAQSASMLTWQEIEQIDWEKTLPVPDADVYRYLRDEDKRDPLAYQTVERNGVLYRMIPRRHFLTADWICLFTLMRELNNYQKEREEVIKERVHAQRRKDSSRVRLVVWFF